MPTYPAARLLTPIDPPSLADDYQTVRSAMRNGLPHLVDLTGNVRLKLTLPTGLMHPWLDLAPDALVASADTERAPRPAVPQEEVGGASRPPLRVSLSEGDVVLAVVALSLGAERTLPDDGGSVRGAAVDLVFLDWAIHAGTACGPGDFGSYVRFAWRLAGQGVNAFGPPVINPFLLPRLKPTQRLQSDLGLVRLRVADRLVARRTIVRGRL